MTQIVSSLMPASWSAIEIVRPVAFGLLVLLVLLAWSARGSLRSGQGWARLAVRCAMLALLIAAIADVRLIRRNASRVTVFLVDRSESMSESAKAAAQRYIADTSRFITAPDSARVVEFGGNAAVEDGHREPKLDRSDTDIAQALRAAWSLIPARNSGTILLLSDGRETKGDARLAAQEIAQGGGRICTIPLRPNESAEVQMTEVKAPAEVREGAPFELLVNVSSTIDQPADLLLSLNGIRVASEKVNLQAGDNQFRFRRIATKDRAQIYSARVVAGQDHQYANNEASAYVTCEGKPRVLILAEDERDSRPFARALRSEDIEAELRRPESSALSLSYLNRFDLVMLNNVSAARFDRASMRAIASYVRDLGGGLVMIGGEYSFGSGGYNGTPLEELLPVRCEIKHEKDEPSLAMVLLIDKSGSMGEQKIELAKAAGRATIDALGPRDQIGIIAFDGAPQWLCPLHSVTDKAFVLERLAGLSASGGTNLAAALTDAYAVLNRSSAQIKHVIAFTDGITQSADFFSIVNAMRDSKITVSTVASSEQADRSLLTNIAKWGHGRSYSVRPEEIPQIFAQETLETSKSGIQEWPFVPVQIRSHAVCEDIDFLHSPVLLGYVRTQPRLTAENILTTPSDEPLLATWRIGAGKALAFTSDAGLRWASEWAAWPGFGRFWSQVARDTMRANAHGTLDVHVERSHDTVSVRVDAMNPDPHHVGEYLVGAQTAVDLIRPDLARESIVLDENQPGEYEGTFKAAAQGNYEMRVTQRINGVEAQALTRGISVGYPDEYRTGPVDDTRLRDIAAAGQGLYDPSPSQIAAMKPGAAREPITLPLSHLFIMLAILLLILDVALQRIDFGALAFLRNGGTRPQTIAKSSRSRLDALSAGKAGRT